MRVLVERDDITTTPVTVIVNAANPYLRGGGGVDGALQRAAGPELLAACRALPIVHEGNGVPIRCPTGEARITPGFNLLAKWVVHAVGPVYDNYSDQEAIRLLAAAHYNSLRLAQEVGATSIAFPAISCGLYGFPIGLAAKVALRIALRGPWDFQEIRFVLFTEETHHAFQHELGMLMPPAPQAPVLFYGHTNGEYRSFSNWYPAEFELDDMAWANSEQAYMYFKSTDPEYRKQVRKTRDPGQVKKLGRNCKLDPNWDNIKYNVMVRVCLAKFSQNEDLKALLLSTGTRSIHEDCRDPWWGGGPNFPGGRDLLGKALMEVRAKLHELQHDPDGLEDRG